MIKRDANETEQKDLEEMFENMTKRISEEWEKSEELNGLQCSKEW